MTYQNQNRNDFSFLDFLDLIIIILQFVTQVKLNRQASNNDLLKELHKDADAIMEKLDRIEKKQGETTNE